MDSETLVTKRPPHLLLVPSGSASHFPTFRQLLYYLAQRKYNGVRVTVVCNQPRISELSKLRTRGDFNGLDLQLEKVFEDPPRDPLCIPRAATYSEQRKQVFKTYQEELVQKKNDAEAPTCIISDMFLCWLQETAEELEIPWYPVIATASWYTLSCMMGSGLQSHGSVQLNNQESQAKHIAVPGLSFSRTSDFPRDILETPEYFTCHSKRLSKAAAILVNTAEELDAPTGGLNGVRIQVERMAMSEHRKVPRVLAVGPMVQMPGFSSVPQSKVVPSQVSNDIASECLQWLDKQPPSSVLYIAFGSLIEISPRAIVELAHALEISRVRFLWVLKAASSTPPSEFLPPDFEVRTRQRGYTTSWAPQTQILLHSSIAGFMTHCGWNSILEGLCAGVPFIAWPLANDEPQNARFIVEVLKVGLELKNVGEDDSQVRRDDLASAIESLLYEEEGREAKRNSLRVQKVVEAAVADQGSSHHALHSFLQEITRPISRYT